MRIELMDRRDIRMVEPGEGERLLAEALANRLVGEHSRGKNLEGDVALQALVTGEIDLSHSPRADTLEDPIMGQGLSNQRFHATASDPCSTGVGTMASNSVGILRKDIVTHSQQCTATGGAHLTRFPDGFVSKRLGSHRALGEAAPEPLDKLVNDST